MAGDPDQFRVSPTTGGLPMLDAPQVQNAGPEQMQRTGQAITAAGENAERPA